MARRSSSSVTNFLQDITDDIKDFVDDEVIDRGRDTERDLRKAGRNWFDSDDDDDRPRGRRSDDISDLRDAVKELAAKVNELSTKKTA
jgi:hypothetical protein